MSSPAQVRPLNISADSALCSAVLESLATRANSQHRRRNPVSNDPQELKAISELHSLVHEFADSFWNLNDEMSVTIPEFYLHEEKMAHLILQLLHLSAECQMDTAGAVTALIELREEGMPR